jgi:hypothetical protein
MGVSISLPGSAEADRVAPQGVAQSGSEYSVRNREVVGSSPTALTPASPGTTEPPLPRAGGLAGYHAAPHRTQVWCGGAPTACSSVW